MRPVALVDARNVLRSRWPNIREDALVRGVERWAEDEGVEPVIVFDGQAPEVETRAPPRRQRQADRRRLDHTEAARLEREGTPYWLITSDRELRERAGGAAARIIGGGTLAASLP